jgi:nucleoside-diphosphate-sugar epimerase
MYFKYITLLRFICSKQSIILSYFMKLNSTLITGIRGFVGTHLEQVLSTKSKVIGVDIINNVDCDLEIYSWEELGSLPETRNIIHLAGIAHDTSGTVNLKKYFDVNLGLTMKIFDYFLKSNSEKFIFFSSVKAVEDSLDSETLDEDVVPNPKTPYGKSKLAAENYILDQKLPLGKKVYILRPCMIHGTGNKGNLNLLYKFQSMGFPYPLGAFENLRSYLSINNLTWVIERIIEGQVPSGIYNLADDEPVSTNELIRLIADADKKKSQIWNVPVIVIYFFAKTGDILRLPFNSERLKKLTESYVVSNAKIKHALGIKTFPFTSKEGLSQTFEFLAR